MSKETVSVCIATYRRPSLRECLASIAEQKLPDNIQLQIIIADNDIVPSAQVLVAEAAVNFNLPIIYLHAPANNISLARNAGLDAAQGEWVAFIDDDEIAQPDWLAALLSKAKTEKADAVFGPALAVYPETAPNWMQDLRIHDNIPKSRGGVVQTGHCCNGLMRRNVLSEDLRFDLSLGQSRREDSAFFFALFHRGGKLAIANDAVVKEAVAKDRLNFDFLAARARRAGQSYARHAAKSKLAMIYIALLAGVKSLYCALRAKLAGKSEAAKNYWRLRGVFHSGALSTLWGEKERQIYRS